MLTTKGISPNLYDHDDDPDECLPAFVSLDIYEPSCRNLNYYITSLSYII